MSSARDHLLSLLLVDSHVMPLERVPARVAEHAGDIGFIGVRIYLSDVQERVLHLLGGPGLTRGQDREETEFQVEGTVPGGAFQYGEAVRTTESSNGSVLWWIPLLDGTEGWASCGQGPPRTTPTPWRV